jgi:hypothetical protein
MRETLHVSGLDAEHYGLAAWSLRSPATRPGKTAAFRPNLVRDSGKPRLANDDRRAVDG